MRKIALVNEKGGSSKTTFAVNIASYFALNKNKRTLLVDTDPQGQVSRALGLSTEQSMPNISDALVENRAEPQQIVHQTRMEKLSVISSDRRMNDFLTKQMSKPDQTQKLAKTLEHLNDFDFTIFDTPPSLGLITQNVLFAADEVVIPIPLTYLALDSCAHVIEAIENLKTTHKRNTPNISLVVPAFFRPTRMAFAILEKLSDYFGRKLAKTVVRFSVKLDEAQSQNLTIWEYAPKSKGAEMLASLSEEIYQTRPRHG